MQQPLLFIENLTVSFINDDEKFTAVENISFTINKGETVAVVGESGSGKSVTSMSILQLHPSKTTSYEAGKIIFSSGEHNTDLLQCSSAEMQHFRGGKIAMIFQEPMTALNPVMRCGDQIIETLLQHNVVQNKTEAKQKAISLLTSVQIPDVIRSIDKYPHELSGGQKQRVMIAMALSCNPQLIICDEPTTALDVTVQKEILLLLQQLQKEFNVSLLFISHDLGIIKNIADTVVVMYKGKVVEQGPVEQIFEQPSATYTKALLACRPALYSKEYRLPTVKDFVNDEKFSAQKRIAVPSFENNVPLITIDNLSIKFSIAKNIFGKTTKWFTAVDNVSLTINKNQTIGLVGESGCGKTTLGRTLAMLQVASNGSFSYNGQLVDKHFANSYKKVVQLVFQDPYSSLNPKITIGDAITEVMLVNKIVKGKALAHKKMQELLQSVELLPEHHNRYPHEFSGGQRQRIVIARALAMQPQFIICDESVSALDVSVQAQILNLLNDLKDKYNFTNLFISHDLNVVQYISDYIYIMQKGKIVEHGEPNVIFNQPQNEYTKKLVGSVLS